MNHSFVVRTISTIVFLLIISAPAQSAEAPLRFSFKGYSAGLLAARADGSLDTRNGRFLLSLQAGDAGISSILSWASRVDATGVLVPQGVAPQRFDLQNRRKNKNSSRSINYSNRMANVSFSPEANIPAHEVISPSQTLNSVDPVAAFMAILNTAEQTGSCNLSLNVFEGKSLYQINVRNAGSEYISERNLSYQGQALRCRMQLVPLAGKATRPKNRSRLTDIDMWLAKPVSNGPMIPIKMSTSVKGIPVSLLVSSAN